MLSKYICTKYFVHSVWFPSKKLYIRQIQRMDEVYGAAFLPLTQNALHIWMVLSLNVPDFSSKTIIYAPMVIKCCRCIPQSL